MPGLMLSVNTPPWKMISRSWDLSQVLRASFQPDGIHERHRVSYHPLAHLVEMHRALKWDLSWVLRASFPPEASAVLTHPDSRAHMEVACQNSVQPVRRHRGAEW